MRARGWPAVVATGALVACGGKPDASAASSGDPATRAATPAPPPEPSAPAAEASAPRDEASATAVAEPAPRVPREGLAAAAPVGVKVADSDQPVALAVANDTVVWLDARRGVVASAPLAGPPPKKLHVLAKGLAIEPALASRAIAFDGTDVFWISGVERKGARHRGVFRVAADGGKLFELAAARAGSGDVAIGGDDVYWLDRDVEDPAAGPAALVVASKKDGHARELVRMAGACALAVDATALYWIELGDKPAIRRADLATADVKTLAPANGAACALTVDDHAVSWLRARGDEVLSVDKAGGAARVVARVHARISGIASSASGLVVLTDMFPDGDRLDAVLWRLSATGGEPAAVARGGLNARLAASGAAVIWSSWDDGGGAIQRAP
jgi:hypothetical protein